MGKIYLNGESFGGGGLDKDFINHLYPKGSIYTTYEYKNPSTFIGGEWELIGGEDADKNYYPAFAISTDTAGTTVAESLPNIKGTFSSRAGYGPTAYFSNTGAYYAITGQYNSEDSDGTSRRGTVNFSAQYGQTNADGTTYVPSTASTYQDGAQVNVNAIKLFFWRRTDDGIIVEQFSAVTFDREVDVLWEGTAGNGVTVTLTGGSMDDYDVIEFTINNQSGLYETFAIERDKVKDDLMLPVSWDASQNRYLYIRQVTSTSFYIYCSLVTLTMVRGIKEGYVGRYANGGGSCDVDPTLDSGSTNPVANSAITVAMDEKMDKQSFINSLYPKGSIYITESNTNPSTFIGGTWELIGGEDADKNYYPAFAIATDSAGTTINESLPNIKANADADYWYINSAKASGAFSHYATGTAHWGDSSGNYPYGVKFDASKGQTNADGTTYVPQTASTYQDGAQVNVEAIKLFFWKRTDDAPIAMMLETITLEEVKDVLWSGDTGSSTITLSGSIDDYDQIEISTLADNTYKEVYVFERDKLVNNALIPVSWADTNRHVHFTNVTSTSLTFGVANCRVTMVRGLKKSYVSRTDITSVIDSGSTNDKAASAKAVYEALNEIEFITKAATHTGGGTGSFSVTITCEADEVPLGLGSTTIATNGAVGYGYVNELVKNSDTSYTFKGWRNVNGGQSTTVFATFVKMPMKKR